MMKTFVLVMLLAISNVHCNVTARYSQKETSRSYLYDAIHSISKAKYNIPKCNNSLNIQKQKPSDCADVLELGHNKSGVYKIWPISRLTERRHVYVYCDMDTSGGGWTVIQRRGDFKTPKNYFDRNWENYKEGFGNIKQDFWLGNDYIFALTNQKLYSARFDLKYVQGDKRYAHYDKFWIDDENHKYTLHLFTYTGDAGNSMDYHNNKTFSTIDQDNVTKCAQLYKGGWWYSGCGLAFLNGLYYKGNLNITGYGINWYDSTGHWKALEWTEIKIRPKYFTAFFS